MPQLRWPHVTRNIGGGTPWSPALLRSLAFHLYANDVKADAATKFVGNASGSITVAAGVCTLTASGVFGGNAARTPGQTITVQTSTANAGTFTIKSSPSANAVTWDNASGVAENFASTLGTWSTSGGVTSATDEKGNAFSAPAANAWGVNALKVPGKTCLSSGISGSPIRYLQCLGAPLLSKFNNAGPTSFALRWQPVAIAGAMQPIFLRDTVVGGGAPSRRAGPQISSLASGFQQTRVDAGGSSVWTPSPAVPEAANAWVTSGFTYDGSNAANAAKFYKNGVLVAQANAATTTVRTLAALAALLITCTNAASSTPLSGNPMFLAGALGAPVVWSAKEMLLLHAWYAKRYP